MPTGRPLTTVPLRTIAENAEKHGWRVLARKDFTPEIESRALHVEESAMGKSRKSSSSRSKRVEWCLVHVGTHDRGGSLSQANLRFAWDSHGLASSARRLGVDRPPPPEEPPATTGLTDDQLSEIIARRRFVAGLAVLLQRQRVRRVPGAPDSAPGLGETPREQKLPRGSLLGPA